MYRKYFRTRSNRAHSVRLSCFQVRKGVGVVSKLGPDLSCNRMSTATTSGLPTNRELADSWLHSCHTTRRYPDLFPSFMARGTIILGR